MGAQTWGTGTDIFAADYLSAQVPNSGSSEWQSSDIYDNMLSALELKRMSGHFDAGVDTTIGSSTPADTPLSLVTEGASPGYYRTIKYSSQYADDYFFSQNVLMYDRHIITNVSDIQRLVWKPTITVDTFNNAPMVDGTTSNIKCYSISQFESNKVDILKKGKTDEYTATGVNIVPAIISPDSANHLQGFNYWGRVDERVTWVDGIVYRYNQTYGSNSNNVARYCPVFGNQSAITLPNSSGETSKWAIDDTGNYAVRFVYKAADQYSYLWTTYCNVKYWICSEDELKHVLARSGMKFVYNNTMYKPVAENGVIIGYTDDMTKESEWDNWHDYTDHEVPVTPPTPPAPSGDDIDDHIMGAGSQLSGIAQLWLLTRAQLIDLHTAFASAPPSYDPMSSFISVMGLGISAFRVVGDSLPWTLNPINIRMANGESWHTGVEGHIVDSQVSAFNEVNIRIQRKYNNFLDYSPYATHEIFLPMCGWLTLPDIAVDRNITVTYIPDIETLKIRAVVSVVDNSGYRCVIGEKDGVMGAEIPFTNIGHSLFLGNTIVQSADIAGEIVTGAIGAGFTKTNAKGGTFRPYEGFTVGMAGTLPGAVGNALVSGNVNRTHFTTGNGSRIGFGDGENIQIKSIYHRIDKPNNYDHTIGKVCNKTGQLSNFTGFTVCENPHINFSATEREKEEIKQLLEQGVIL